MKATPHLARLGAVMILLATHSSLCASYADERLEGSAKTSVRFKTHLKDDSITTRSTDGGATPAGTVADGSHKSPDTVRALPGVTRVDNRLQMKAGNHAEPADDWLRTRAKTMLLFHRNANTSRTSVYVAGGIGKSHGEASIQAKPALATGSVRDNEGMRGVTSPATVKAVASKSTLRIAPAHNLRILRQ